jgi:hypothetical protein
MKWNEMTSSLASSIVVRRISQYGPVGGVAFVPSIHKFWFDSLIHMARMTRGATERQPPMTELEYDPLWSFSADSRVRGGKAASKCTPTPEYSSE